MFTKLQDYLKGKKSYFLANTMALYVALKAFGILEVTETQDKAVLGLLLALFGVTITAKLNRNLIK